MLGEFIQQQRKKHEMTQEDLASKLNISRPTYMQIESGNRELKVSEAKTLADLFNMSLESFVAEKESGHRVVIEKGASKKVTDLNIRVTRKDMEKFRQVLLYILSKVGAKPNIDETVLHKLLYFIDFDYYEKFEENLMGATYIKNHHGPTSVELGAILKEMEEQEDVTMVKRKYLGHTQKKYLPLKFPDLSLLSARELSHIDGVLARLSDKNADEIEQYACKDIPWRSAEDGEQINYESVFYRSEEHSVGSYDEL